LRSRCLRPGEESVTAPALAVPPHLDALVRLDPIGLGVALPPGRVDDVEELRAVGLGAQAEAFAVELVCARFARAVRVRDRGARAVAGGEASLLPGHRPGQRRSVAAQGAQWARGPQPHGMTSWATIRKQAKQDMCQPP